MPAKPLRHTYMKLRQSVYSILNQGTGYNLAVSTVNNPVRDLSNEWILDSRTEGRGREGRMGDSFENNTNPGVEQ